MPELVGTLPPAWDVSVAALWRGDLRDRRPAVGMLHFNGGGASKESAFLAHGYIVGARWNRTWGVATYYERLSWSWAQFIAQSRVPPGQGHTLIIDHNTTKSEKIALLETGTVSSI